MATFNGGRRMENLQLRNLNKFKTALSLTIALSASTVLSGCGEGVSVIEDATEIYDTIDSNDGEIEIEPQVLDVKGEDFKLVVEYDLDEDTSKKWRITDNKKIYTEVYTEGLDKDTKVWIDNVHTDTTLVASNEIMNGITQDTMDDRIHNSLMYGFPISDTVKYSGSNQIDGQNDTFISGSFYGFNGYSSGSIDEQRYTEENYLEHGVYGNKISSTYDLLIQKGDNEPYVTSVDSDIVVIAYNIITKSDGDTYKYYQYNRDGSYEEIDKPKTKTK